MVTTGARGDVMEIRLDDVVVFTAEETKKFSGVIENPLLAALEDHWAMVQALTQSLLGFDPDSEREP